MSWPFLYYLQVLSPHYAGRGEGAGLQAMGWLCAQATWTPKFAVLIIVLSILSSAPASGLRRQPLDLNCSGSDETTRSCIRVLVVKNSRVHGYKLNLVPKIVLSCPVL